MHCELASDIVKVTDIKSALKVIYRKILSENFREGKSLNYFLFEDQENKSA